MVRPKKVCKRRYQVAFFMKKIVVPKIFSQMMGFIGIQWFMMFLVFSLSNSNKNFDLTGYYGNMVITFFMASQIWWILLAAGSDNSLRDRYLAALPLTRLQIARSPTYLFFFFYIIAVMLVALSTAVLYLGSWMDFKELYRIGVIGFLSPTITLFSYLIAKAINSVLARIFILLASLIGSIAVFISIDAEEVFSKNGVWKYIILSLVIILVSLLILRKYEKDFVESDLI